MAADPLDALRLALMQEVLPVGMAVVDRARRGGPGTVVEVFTAAADPLAQLREEGEPAARRVREGLDRLQPGLGNPVVKVSVEDIPAAPSDGSAAPGAPPLQSHGDRQALQRTLVRISARLNLLEQRLAVTDSSHSA